MWLHQVLSDVADEEARDLHADDAEARVANHVSLGHKRCCCNSKQAKQDCAEEGACISKDILSGMPLSVNLDFL